MIQASLSEEKVVASYQLFHGNCLDMLDLIPDNSVDLMFTSPPYAEQRKNQYGGIPESEFPQWCVSWMNKLKRIMKPNGSVAINIRPNIKNGQISDYTLKTRLAIRESGWIECEELIWIKKDAPPVGSLERPRRAYESIHWFSLSSHPFVNLTANGKPSNKLGLSGKKGLGEYVNGNSDEYQSGVARCQDIIDIPVSLNDRTTNHPATFPVSLSDWMIKMLCPEGGTACDIFTGSGTVGVSSAALLRDFIGIELFPLSDRPVDKKTNPNYFFDAEERIRLAYQKANPS